MGKRLFERVSLEDIEENTPATVVEVEPTDSIALQKELDEVDAIEKEFNELEDLAETAEDVADELEDQIDSTKEALQNPETVTEGTVTGAMESLRLVNKILGIKKPLTISKESIGVSPVDALKIALEEKKEVLEKIEGKLDGINDQYEENLNDLLGSVESVVGKLKEHAVALQADMEKEAEGKGDVTVSEDDKKFIADKLAAVLVQNGEGKFSVEAIVKNIETAVEMGSVEAYAAVVAGLIEAVKPVAEMTEGQTVTGSTIKGVFEAIKAAVGPVAEKKVRLEDGKITEIKCEFPEVASDEISLTKAEAVAMLEDVEIEVEDKEVEVKPEDIGAIKYEDILTIVKAISVSAEKVADVKKSVEDMVAKVNESAKAVEGKEGYEPVEEYANLATTLIAKDIVFNYIDSIRDSLTVVNTVFGAASGSVADAGTQEPAVEPATTDGQEPAATDGQEPAATDAGTQE